MHMAHNSKGIVPLPALPSATQKPSQKHCVHTSCSYMCVTLPQPSCQQQILTVFSVEFQIYRIIEQVAHRVPQTPFLRLLVPCIHVDSICCT